jgi:hypothetical protein
MKLIISTILLALVHIKAGTFCFGFVWFAFSFANKRISRTHPYNLSRVLLFTDIVVENDIIKPEDVFDFVVLQDSDHWWEARNVTKYYCIMRSLWNPQNHPNKYPQLARMSNPLIYSGRKEFRPWLINRQTTIGVEKLAETGFTDKFRYEIDAAG